LTCISGRAAGGRTESWDRGSTDMTLLADVAHRYPLVIAVTVLVAIALIAFAADWFVGRAERDELAARR